MRHRPHWFAAAMTAPASFVCVFVEWARADAEISAAAAASGWYSVEPQSPAEVWDRVARVYRSSLIAERIRISVYRPTSPGRAQAEPGQRTSNVSSTEESRSVVFFRSFPGDDRIAGPRFRLEMLDVTVFGEPGRILASRAGVPGGIVVRDFDGRVSVDRLEEMMPPIPIPHLAWIAPGRSDEVFAGVGAPTWRSIERRRDAGGEVVVLGGDVADGGSTRSIEAVVMESTSRLVGMRLFAPGSSDRVEIEWSVGAIEAGDPAAWAPETAGRQVVSTIDQLRTVAPGPRPRPGAGTNSSVPGDVDKGPADRAQVPGSPVGEVISRLYLFDPAASRWSSERGTSEFFAGVLPIREGPARIAMLLITWPDDSSVTSSPKPLPAEIRRAAEIVAKALEAVRSPERGEVRAGEEAVHADENRDETQTFAVAAAVFEVDGFDEGRLMSLSRRWSDSVGGSIDGAMPLLCSPAGRGAIARYGGPQRPLVVVLDEGLKIVDVIAIDASDQVSSDAATARLIGAMSGARADPK